MLRACILSHFACAVSDTLAAASPTLHLTDQSQQLQRQELASFHQTLSGQLSEHAELSQGSYPPWLLQGSNPGLCIPDSLGTQSPLQNNRQLPIPPVRSPMPPSQQLRSSHDQPATVNVQQQEAHKRNAAALQELMTQADASEPEADDYVADSAVDQTPADANTVADAVAAAMMQPTSSDAAHAFRATAHARSTTTEVVPESGGPASGLPAHHALPAARANPAEPAVHAALAEQPQGRAEGSRGAGTPAGPQEEFYSPQEHFHDDAPEQQDVLVQPVNAPQASTTADDQTGPAPAAQTALDHKTPAPSKRRKGSKRYGFLEVSHLEGNHM